MSFRFFRRWMRGSRELADDFISSGIEDWAAEGRISNPEMRWLQAALGTAEVAAVTANLGAHFAMSIPLRFPLSSLARFGWTLGGRVRARPGASGRSGRGCAVTPMRERGARSTRSP